MQAVFESAARALCERSASAVRARGAASKRCFKAPRERRASTRASTRAGTLAGHMIGNEYEKETIL